jgi:hypothetical protein
MVKGPACPTGEPDAGVANAAKGLLSWGQWQESVIAPSVFPWIPCVVRPFTPLELLSALDVPAVRIKAADVPTMDLWGRELSLPFKVWVEVLIWVRSILGKQKHSLEEQVDPEAKQIKLALPSSTAVTDVGTDGDTPPQADLQQANQKHDDAEFRFTYGMIVRGKTRT